jgi:universal stress protein A
MLTIQNIVVPVDFSTHSRQALEYAMRLAKLVAAKVHMVHVFHMPVIAAAAYDIAAGAARAPADFWSEMEAATSEKLETLSREVDTEGVEFSTRVVTDDPAHGIVELAKSLNADLIVMGTHGRTGLRHIALGSVAERTIRSAPCPVLTLRAADEGEPMLS